MNVHNGRPKSNIFRILLENGCIFTILTGKITGNKKYKPLDPT